MGERNEVILGFRVHAKKSGYLLFPFVESENDEKSRVNALTEKRNTRLSGSGFHTMMIVSFTNMFQLKADHFDRCEIG
jgi:hypothetical protein